MKKIYSSMILILLSTQFLFPISSFAEISLENDDQVSITSESSKDQLNNTMQSSESSASSSQSQDASTSISKSDAVTNTSDYVSENTSLPGENITVSSAYLDNSHMTANNPLKITISIDKPTGVDVSNTQIILSNFDSQYVNLSKTKLVNGTLSDTYGSLSINTDLGEISYTFNSDITANAAATFTISFLVYGQELTANSPTQTLDGSYINQEGTTSDITNINSNYIVSKGDTGSATETRVQAPGKGIYNSGNGVLSNNFAGNGVVPGTTNTGGGSFYPTMQYMALNNVFDPGNITINDTDRTYTFSVSGSATIDINKIFLIIHSSSAASPSYTLNSDYFASIGSYSLSSDKKTLILSFKDNVAINWDVINMNISTPNVDEVYTTTWKYTATSINSTVTESIISHSAKQYFLQDGTSGFIPKIVATDKSIKIGSIIDSVDSWLLSGVTATDVEDGDLTKSVTVKNDGGFSNAWENKTPGVYTITYSVTDSSGNTVTATSTATIYSDITIHYEDSSGNKLKADTILSGNVGDTYTIDTSDFSIADKNYYYVSSTPDVQTGKYGDNAQPTEVTLVYAENKQTITVKDSTIYAGISWTPNDNFVSATDKDGNTIDFTDVTIVGTVDTSKAGEYKVTYTNGDSSAVATITVKENKQAITVKDSTIYTGASWTANDNFVSATDKDGNTVDFTDVTIEGTVDTSKEGEYKVTYTNGDSSAAATITVKENKQTITVKDSTIYTGASWTANNNFVSATDKDGNTVDFTDVTIEGTVDTSKAGEYKVTYTNGDSSAIATITVKENKQTITVKDSTIYTGASWTANNNFVSATDKDGNTVDFADVTTVGTVDTSKAGEYKVTYTNGDSSAIATITVKERIVDPTDSNNGSSIGKGNGTYTGTETASKSALPSSGSTNTKSPLPNTGETNSSLLTVIGAITLLTSGIYALNTKRKRSN